MRNEAFIIVDLIIHMCKYKVKKIVVDSKTLYNLKKSKEIKELRLQKLFKNCKHVY